MLFEASKRGKISRNQNEGKLIFILLHDFVAMVFMMANTSPETTDHTTTALQRVFKLFFKYKYKNKKQIQIQIQIQMQIQLQI